ncbi:hypothetical protein [Nocardia carnea]|uniref:hypothetical protein n=1 Tax=Nocardia carnea TaxID=37328 RepID=UPI0024554068|nr:hypothetical protein [Nocardia carnea]
MTTPEPIHDLARGDVAVSRQLSKALQVIMAGTTDPQLKNQIRAILDGRGSARELMRSDAFNVVLDRTMPAAMQQFADMPEEERQRFAAQGQAQLDQLRDQPAQRFVAPRPPGPPPAPPAEPQPAPAATALTGRRRSYKDQIVTPDEPDEDDIYFSERRKNGWLQ